MNQIMINVEGPMNQALHSLAHQRNQSVSEIAHAALETFLEDAYLGAVASERMETDSTRPYEEFLAELGDD